MKRGNCYYASEALWHILGGRSSAWRPLYIPRCQHTGYETHWFLKHKTTGLILDPSRRQFTSRKPPYHLGVPCGFLTRFPSAGARKVMETLTWQN